jgi:hypothetical protein
MAPGAGLKDRLKYAIDNTFSQGPGALILWLGVLSLGEKDKIILLADN